MSPAHSAIEPWSTRAGRVAYCLEQRGVLLRSAARQLHRRARHFGAARIGLVGGGIGDIALVGAARAAHAADLLSFELAGGKRDAISAAARRNSRGLAAGWRPVPDDGLCRRNSREQQAEGGKRECNGLRCAVGLVAAPPDIASVGDALPEMRRRLDRSFIPLPLT